MILIKNILKIPLLIIGLAIIPLSQAEAKIDGLSGTSPTPHSTSSLQRRTSARLTAEVSCSGVSATLSAGKPQYPGRP